MADGEFIAYVDICAGLVRGF